MVVAFVFLLQVGRRPDALFNPQFWAEDGYVFFKDQLLLGLSHSLLLEYAGYLHFVPRMVAAFASWFPVARAPFLYNLAATAIEALALSLFALPAYRYVMRPDYLRVAVCIVAACVFSAPEVISNLTDAQWFLALGALVLLFYPVPERLAGSLRFQFLTGGIGLVVVCTSPQTLILLPFVLWKLYPFAWRRSAGPLLVLAGMFIQGAVALTVSPAGAAGVTKPLLQTAAITLMAPAYRCILGDFVGDLGAMGMAARATPALNVSAAFVFVVWLIWLFRATSGLARWSVAVVVYCLFASIAIVAARRPYGGAFDFSGPWTEWEAGRYTLLGSTLIVYLVALTLERALGRYGAHLPTVCLLGAFFYGAMDHYRAPACAEMDWPKQARQIETWINGNAIGGSAGGVTLKLNPAPGPLLYLPARLRAATPQSPWEGCLVRGQGVIRKSAAVFWIEKGQAHPVTEDWIRQRGLLWTDDVRAVPQFRLDAIPKAP